MELVLQRYGSFEAFQQVTGGGLLTRSRIWHNVKKYMEKEGCLGEVGRAALSEARRTPAALQSGHVHVIGAERQTAGRHGDERVCGKH